VDPNTSTPKNQPTDDAVVKNPPSVGFTVLYHPVLDLLLKQPSTVLRTYLALCSLGNGGKVTKNLVATVAHRAAGGEEFNFKEDACVAAIQKLRELGFLKVVPRAGKPDEYYIMPFLPEAPEKPVEKPRPDVPIIQSQRDENVYRAAQQIFDAEPVPDPWETPQPQPEPTRRGNGDLLPSTPYLSPWWKDHQDHLKFLDALIKNHPKDRGQTPQARQWAMEAWEELFSNGPELTQQEQHAIWQGHQRWLEVWLEERTEDKFIPQLSSWIKKERWAHPKVNGN